MFSPRHEPVWRVVPMQSGGNGSFTGPSMEPVSRSRALQRSTVVERYERGITSPIKDRSRSSSRLRKLGAEAAVEAALSWPPASPTKPVAHAARASLSHRRPSATTANHSSIAQVSRAIDPAASVAEQQDAELYQAVMTAINRNKSIRNAAATAPSKQDASVPRQLPTASATSARSISAGRRPHKDQLPAVEAALAALPPRVPRVTQQLSQPWNVTNNPRPGQRVLASPTRVRQAAGVVVIPSAAVASQAADADFDRNGYVLPEFPRNHVQAVAETATQTNNEDATAVLRLAGQLMKPASADADDDDDGQRVDGQADDPRPEFDLHTMKQRCMHSNPTDNLHCTNRGDSGTLIGMRRTGGGFTGVATSAAPVPYALHAPNSTSASFGGGRARSRSSSGSRKAKTRLTADVACLCGTCNALRASAASAQSRLLRFQRPTLTSTMHIGGEPTQREAQHQCAHTHCQLQHQQQQQPQRQCTCPCCPLAPTSALSSLSNNAATSNGHVGTDSAPQASSTTRSSPAGLSSAASQNLASAHQQHRAIAPSAQVPAASPAVVHAPTIPLPAHGATVERGEPALRDGAFAHGTASASERADHSPAAGAATEPPPLTVPDLLQFMSTFGRELAVEMGSRTLDAVNAAMAVMSESTQPSIEVPQQHNDAATRVHATPLQSVGVNTSLPPVTGAKQRLHRVTEAARVERQAAHAASSGPYPCAAQQSAAGATRVPTPAAPPLLPQQVQLPGDVPPSVEQRQQPVPHPAGLQQQASSAPTSSVPPRYTAHVNAVVTFTPSRNSTTAVTGGDGGNGSQQQLKQDDRTPVNAPPVSHSVSQVPSQTAQNDTHSGADLKVASGPSNERARSASPSKRLCQPTRSSVLYTEENQPQIAKARLAVPVVRRTTQQQTLRQPVELQQQKAPSLSSQHQHQQQQQQQEQEVMPLLRGRFREASQERQRSVSSDARRGGGNAADEGHRAHHRPRSSALPHQVYAPPPVHPHWDGGDGSQLMSASYQSHAPSDGPARRDSAVAAQGSTTTTQDAARQPVSDPYLSLLTALSNDMVGLVAESQAAEELVRAMAGEDEMLQDAEASISGTDVGVDEDGEDASYCTDGDADAQAVQHLPDHLSAAGSHGSRIPNNSTFHAATAQRADRPVPSAIPSTAPRRPPATSVSAASVSSRTSASNSNIFAYEHLAPPASASVVSSVMPSRPPSVPLSRGSSVRSQHSMAVGDGHVHQPEPAHHAVRNHDRTDYGGHRDGEGLVSAPPATAAATADRAVRRHSAVSTTSSLPLQHLQGALPAAVLGFARDSVLCQLLAAGSHAPQPVVRSGAPSSIASRSASIVSLHQQPAGSWPVAPGSQLDKHGTSMQPPTGGVHNAPASRVMEASFSSMPVADIGVSISASQHRSSTLVSTTALPTPQQRGDERPRQAGGLRRPHPDRPEQENVLSDSGYIRLASLLVQEAKDAAARALSTR